MIWRQAIVKGRKIIDLNTQCHEQPFDVLCNVDNERQKVKSQKSELRFYFL